MRFFFELSFVNINLLDFSYLRFSSNINVMLKKLAFVFAMILTFMLNQSIYSQDDKKKPIQDALEALKKSYESKDLELIKTRIQNYVK